MKLINISIDNGDIMARPQPFVLIEHNNKTTYLTTQIVEAEHNAIWAVFYKNKAFNLKTFNSITSFPGPKYKKTSFSNAGHAYNLAKKLNKQFECNDFTVEKLPHDTI